MKDSARWHLCNRIVTAAFHATIQLWSIMISNDGGLITREIGQVSEIGLSGEKGSEENHVTVMGTMCLNGAL